MRQIKWIPSTEPPDRETWASVLRGNGIGTIVWLPDGGLAMVQWGNWYRAQVRSEEHTSELQSH